MIQNLLVRTLACMALLAACLTLSPSSMAHDLWMLPKPWVAGPGQTSELDLMSGMKFPTPDLDEAAYTPEKMARAMIHGPGVSRDLPAPRVEEGVLRYEARLDAPGLYCVAAETKPTFALYSAEEFEKYLREDGFPQAADERRRLGETALEGKEFYTEYAHAIFRVRETKELAAADSSTQGGGTMQEKPRIEAQRCRPIGRGLEILLDSDPTLLVAGGTLSIQVLYEGHPAPGAAVRAMAEGDEQARHTALTDEQGRAQFTLEHPGAWAFMTGWIQRRSDRSKADWHSHWASLTFAISPEPSAGR